MGGTTREKKRIEEAVEKWKQGDPSWIEDGTVRFLAELSIELLVYAQTVYREIEQSLAQIDKSLTMTDARVLARLWSVESDSISGVSQVIHLPRTTIHYSFAKLEKKEWIERREGIQRADQPEFAVTKLGREKFASACLQFFAPQEGNVVFDYVARSSQPMVAAAMAVRGVAQIRQGECFAEHHISEAEQMVEALSEIMKSFGK